MGNPIKNNGLLTVLRIGKFSKTINKMDTKVKMGILILSCFM